MKNWKRSINKTGQGLLGGVCDKKRSTSSFSHFSDAKWGEKLDNIGSGLLHGLTVKDKDRTNGYSPRGSSTWRNDPFDGKAPTRPHISNVAFSSVHGIPCYDIVGPQQDTGKQLNISLPIHLLTAKEMENLGTPPPPADTPTSGLDNNRKRDTRKPVLRVEIASTQKPTVRDLSPTVADLSPTIPPFSISRNPKREFLHCRFCPCDLPASSTLCVHFERCGCGRIQYSYTGLVESNSIPHHNDTEFTYCCPAFTTPRDSKESEINNVTPESTVSTRGKMMYPSMKKIPGDLPCHERYTALSRSRSTRALKSQKVWPVSWTTGDDSFAMRDDNVEDIISLRSSGSSVYSQKTISEESVSSWEYASPR